MTDAEHDAALNQAVTEGGAYEVIRKRLEQQAQTLESRVQALNQRREAEFGRSTLSLLGQLRVRTDNNCVPRDIVRVGDTLLFGYNVFIGLKMETQVADVFSLYRLRRDDNGFDVTPAESPNFLDEAAFRKDFDALYAYYKNAQLLQLQVKDAKLLATFQIGEKITDIRVFRWRIGADGAVGYIDDRGERDAALPPRYDFEWTKTGREQRVNGKHPHVSILDLVFVETLGGDLTVKIENNTEDGYGIYREPVDDPHQTLDDAEINYAHLGDLILLKIKPYREKHDRYLVYNVPLQRVTRIDAIGRSCVQLPEDQGIIFPGGYYLQNGEYKTFPDDLAGFRFKRAWPSPNGEDVLYAFYEEVEGKIALFAYNLIAKTLQNPIYAHGYGLYEDGTLVAFRAENPEPTRNHPMHVWQTPFYSDEHAAQRPAGNTVLGRIGNAELVRGISELYGVCRAARQTAVSALVYQNLIKHCQRLSDSYFWLADPELGGLAGSVAAIAATAGQVLDEFEKVQSIRRQADQALAEAENTQLALLAQVRGETYRHPEQFVRQLNALRRQHGQLLTLKEQRYIDVERLEALQQTLLDAQQALNAQTAAFLGDDQALDPYRQDIEQAAAQLAVAETVGACSPVLEQLEAIGRGLDLLTEWVGSLEVQDATQRTAILERIAALYAQLNQTKAHARNQRNSLGEDEMLAEFGAQFALFAQSIAGALDLADTPEQCDAQQTRLLVQLEEMESRFGEQEQFLADILAKREELYESFAARKQNLLDARQRRAQTMADAAERILAGIRQRAEKFTAQDELNAYFAADPVLQKARSLAEQLRGLDDAVKADDIAARLKAIQDQALRALRDKQELFEDGGQTIRLGRHRFSVNSQALDLTLVSKQQQLMWHLSGTDYYEAVSEPRLEELAIYGRQAFISETEEIYRSEYLAAEVFAAAERGAEHLSLEVLRQAAPDLAALTAAVRRFAAPRYQEGYEKGVHDHDAARILGGLLALREQAGLLCYAPEARALAQLFWAQSGAAGETWPGQAQSAQRLAAALQHHAAYDRLVDHLRTALATFAAERQLPFDAVTAAAAADYLVQELAQQPLVFRASAQAERLLIGLEKYLQNLGHAQQWNATLAQLGAQPAEQWHFAASWLRAYAEAHEDGADRRFVPEAAAWLLAEVERTVLDVALGCPVPDLLGEHPRIERGVLQLDVDRFFARINRHRQLVVPQFRRFHALRKELLEQRREQLRLEQYQPKPLTAFVRNRLINDAYLPLIGDNLAKQMGAAGQGKRTDLMGLLMLISPPGYGKTTLMEYVAHRLGLVFMKINGPAIGHRVHALDPQQAPNAAARQELEKLNLALEMGANVMLYLDDIQHTHAEFLQKFISLCDGTRRIEGVWQGQSKTYDLRGKKFCIVMAGNPYTESGELFKIPDMLANRADVYNLGDILSGRDEIFALSYLENALTSNPVLAPLATRDMDDVYRLIELAQGRQVAMSDLKHAYSSAEANEIVAVLKKLIRVQQLLLRVNQCYIASAATADAYRSEPPFKLQGSYRNMNKIAEKIVAVMDDAELQAVISDHYQGEAQLLTTGAEENLLKLAELRGMLDAAQAARWQAVKDAYARKLSLGDETLEPALKIVGQLADIAGQLQSLQRTVQQAAPQLAGGELQRQLEVLRGELAAKSAAVNIVNYPLPGLDKAFAQLAAAIETSILPVALAMDKKIDLDLNILHKVGELSANLRAWQKTQVEVREDVGLSEQSGQ
ncbi:MAG: DNA repair ATPase [Gammaproteobacteria bacterium]